MSEIGITTLPSGQIIKVVDTPGIMDTEDRDVLHEVTRSIVYLNPGPHAFLLVLQPNRATKEEMSSLKELENLFGDDSFYQNTILIMVRRNEIVYPNGSLMDIHTFIADRTCSEVKQLYEMCGKRIIAVENFDSNFSIRDGYRNQIFDMIRTFYGYYSHDYFKMVLKYKDLLELIDVHAQERNDDKRKLEGKISELQAKIQHLNDKSCVIS
ncbi:GTPase IMAP family member 9-like [Mytilus edulis]|uniref:GTPase IMAP family member 9-like n=1 Tax=Mytilus edulis TaxID=6550 RepID=UPI0039F10308